MSIALPGAWGLFRNMQEALRHMEGKLVTLTKGFHYALADFCWLTEDLVNPPTRLYELLPLQPTLGSYHEASGYMYGGALLLGHTVVTRTPQPQPSAADTSPYLAGAHPTV